MKTPGNWARPETWLEIMSLIFFSAPCKIQGIFFAKKVVGHNFWTEGPTDLRLTFLSCIFDGLFGDTPLDHIFSHMPICPKYGSFWAVFGNARLPRLFTFPKSNDCVLRFSGDGLGEVTEEIVSSRPRYLCRYAIRLQHCLQVLSSPSFNKKTFCAKNGYFITTREGFGPAPWKGDKNILSMPGASYSS